MGYSVVGYSVVGMGSGGRWGKGDVRWGDVSGGRWGRSNGKGECEVRGEWEGVYGVEGT